MIRAGSAAVRSTAAAFALGGAVAQTIAWRPEIAHAIADVQMVYDSVRGRFIALANTFTQFNVLGPQVLSEWDGTKWHPRAPLDPGGARQGWAMTFDRARGRVVVFGGTQNSQLLNDVAEYDGVGWTTKAPLVRPTPRFSAALAFDLARGTVLMAGGVAMQGASRSALNDTWRWDGQQWSPLGTAPTLDVSAMASHPSTGTVVMLGFAASSLLMQTWTFDGAVWTQRQPLHTPPTANNYRMATDLANDRVLLLAGGSLPVWQWDGLDWSPGPLFDGRS